MFTAIIPSADDDTVNIVEDNFGIKLGRVLARPIPSSAIARPPFKTFTAANFTTHSEWSRSIRARDGRMSYELAAEILRRAELENRSFTAGH